MKNLEFEYVQQDENFVKRADTPFGSYFIIDDTDDFTGWYLDFVSFKELTWFGSGKITSQNLMEHVHEDGTEKLEKAAQTHFEKLVSEVTK